MKPDKHANTLLMELMIMILFLMLGSSVLIRIFEKSYLLNRDAHRYTYALTDAQNLSDRLYRSEDFEETLSGLGFSGPTEEGTWRLEREDYVIEAGYSLEQLPDGGLRSGFVRALAGEEEILTLPWVRYIPER